MSASHWEREQLAESILAALAAAGKNLDALTIDDLAITDQFHGGGKPATVRLARLFGAAPGQRVLDVGGGLGGPARTLAVEFGCRVTVVDLTESFVRAARVLTARLGLDDRVSHHVGDALDLRFDDGAFDVVWTQNSGMNIADKARLYAGFHRVLRPGGLLAAAGADGRARAAPDLPADVGDRRRPELPAAPRRDARADRRAPASPSARGRT